MNTHTKLSPSKRVRWSVCPASVKEEAMYPDTKSGEAAVDGTHSHSLLAFCIEEGLIDPGTMVGETLVDSEGAFVVSAEQAKRVKMAVEYIKSASKRCSKIQTEKKVSLKFLTGRDDLDGTLDVLIRTGDTIEIIDYKDGRVAVEAVGNLQLEQYAIGVLSEDTDERKVMRHWDERIGQIKPVSVYDPDTIGITKINLTIIQPRASIPISTWHISSGDMVSRIQELKYQATLTDSVNQIFVPGEPQCTYCKARSNCKALANLVTDTFELAGRVDLTKKANTLNDKDIKRIIELSPLIKRTLDDIEEAALARLLNGEKIAGIKLGVGRNYRTWKVSPEEVIENLQSYGVPKEALFESKLIKPSSLSKISWLKDDGSIGFLTDLQVDVLTEAYVSKTKGAVKIIIDDEEDEVIKFFVNVNGDI